MTASYLDTWAAADARGIHLRQKGRCTEALELYREALQRFPRHIVLLNGLGLALLDAGRHGEAREAFTQAMRLDPKEAALVFNYGNAVRASGEPAVAIGAYEQALALGLTRPEVYNNLGIALQECDRWDDALCAFAEAHRRDPEYSPALANAGHALIQTGRPADAIAPLREAVAKNPRYADAHWLLSHALLVTGQWPEGFDEYEWRWHRMSNAPYRRSISDEWHGEDVQGKRLLLYAEQGAGDAVQFIRYAPLVRDRGAEVIVECHEELVELLRGVDGVASVHARGSAPPAYDLACPLLSLPSRFRTTVSGVPCAVPYLHPDELRVRQWKRALAPHDATLNVGLVWAGSAAHANDRKRSLPPELLAPLASVPGVRYFSLQKGAAGDARCVLPSALPLVDWTGGLRDFADTAAFIHQLDLVVTVDTAVAHVAGALGKAVWLALPFVPDWRWLLDRETSPWYPSMWVFRQPEPGSWVPVVSCLRSQLERFPRSRT